MSNQKIWKPLTRYILSYDKNGNEKHIKEKTYRTREQFLKEYKVQTFWEINNAVYERERVNTYKHSNGKIYKRTQRTKTVKGYRWKIGL